MPMVVCGRKLTSGWLNSADSTSAMPNIQAMVPNVSQMGPSTVRRYCWRISSPAEIEQRRGAARRLPEIVEHQGERHEKAS